MITLYQFEISPFCDKVRRILQVKKQKYMIEEFTVGQVLTGKLKKLNPANKVPVLRHNNFNIADSTAIAYYLEEQFPDPGLIPTDAKDKALVHFFEDWADESLYFYEMYLRFGVPHNAERWLPELTKYENSLMRVVGAKVAPRMVSKACYEQGVARKSLDQLKNDIERHVQSVTQWLKGTEWLVANRLTLADIAVFVQFACIRGTKEGEEVIRAYPDFIAWMERVDQATKFK